MTKPWFKKLPFGQSRLGRLIFGLNIIGLLVLVIGALVLNELRQGLITAQKESLTAQALQMSEVIAQAATTGVPEPSLDAHYASQLLARFIPAEQRARLYDEQGNPIVDSTLVMDMVEVTELPPARKPGEAPPKDKSAAQADMRAAAEKELRQEVMMALAGAEVATVRRNDRGVKVVSVSVPLRRVKQVLGVLTIERDDFESIVQAQRLAMVPFILVALGVTLFSSLLLNFLVSRPIQRLSAAADSVRAGHTRAISLPDLEARKDEIGTLARSLESMTDTLWRRMEEIDRFAADVSHEIKNPLTSIRSALETLDLVKDDKAKERLLAVVNQDVRRLDRLITDISNASRLDAELSRDTPRRLEVGVLLEDIVSLYRQGQKPGEAQVMFVRERAQAMVNGREGPLGQVFRNVIDNARSFSPQNGEVRVTLTTNSDQALPVLIRFEDDGPGIPDDNLETIFQRFYTSRPKGTSFGRNSGLGLSISRQIVEAHYGRIWAENRTDGDGKVVGARFHIALPTL
ncbi:stimulus-sensing domain-containing protein [Asticcacaulis sp. AC402]|uniref:stimulus-sensing domain-containing protein n=1 Tax=Asticcacaulis sp. AC402 TaxID=1282361 RepID=UPI0003C3D711|nr:stimulus-sensing domain-containing protein [Asticcacaulis sp. AC402]ESQ74307.1 histidine kinase [Asticcacaulis sp. AC402]